jgi:hypothetical protein
MWRQNFESSATCRDESNVATDVLAKKKNDQKKTPDLICVDQQK